MGKRHSKRLKDPGDGTQQEPTIHGMDSAKLHALMVSTKMSREEILKWHAGFMIDCPSGRLSKKEFMKIYEELFPSGRAKKFCELVFNVFDKEKLNTIDFGEFIIACSLTSRGKPKDNIAMAFEIYDSNNDATLQREEMKIILEAVHELYEGKIACLIRWNIYFSFLYSI
jgi:Ca2+-binding EF-hand superfamily protein